MTSHNAPWYSEGLRFSCTGCGHCCRIEGHVWVGFSEIGAIASLLGLGLDAFGRRFLRRVGSRFSLTDKPNGDCIFWEDGCSIYESRPGQCRTFPFWSQNLDSPTTWKQASRECEGIGEGRLYQICDIKSLQRGRGETSDGPTAKENRILPPEKSPASGSSSPGSA